MRADSVATRSTVVETALRAAHTVAINRPRVIREPAIANVSVLVLGIKTPSANACLPIAIECVLCIADIEAVRPTKRPCSIGELGFGANQHCDLLLAFIISIYQLKVEVTVVIRRHRVDISVRELGKTGR